MNRYKFQYILTASCIISGIVNSSGIAGAWPKVIDVYKGNTPKLDGVIDKGEYDDATKIATIRGWTPQFNPTTDSNDLAAVIWIKHDGKNLYFAFDVSDDVLYGIDTARWLPVENPKAHDFTRDSYPWFGDGVEVMINASNKWYDGNEADIDVNSMFGTIYNAGNGSSWQMVCNFSKSRREGIGVGGLTEGENRNNPVSWVNYAKWIDTGAMKAVVKRKTDSKGFIVEWMIKPNPCLEISPGKFWSSKCGDVKMGLNIAVQDVDEKEKGKGNFGNFNHEDWWAGEKDNRTKLKQWGTMIVHSGQRPSN
jgi:solute:Na+ symporter, SSS family